MDSPAPHAPVTPPVPRPRLSKAQSPPTPEAPPMSPTLGIPSPTPTGGVDNPEYLSLEELRALMDGTASIFHDSLTRDPGAASASPASSASPPSSQRDDGADGLGIGLVLEPPPRAAAKAQTRLGSSADVSASTSSASLIDPPPAASADTASSIPHPQETNVVLMPAMPVAPSAAAPALPVKPIRWSEESSEGTGPAPPPLPPRPAIPPRGSKLSLDSQPPVTLFTPTTSAAASSAASGTTLPPYEIPPPPRPIDLDSEEEEEVAAQPAEPPRRSKSSLCPTVPSGSNVCFSGEVGLVCPDRRGDAERHLWAELRDGRLSFYASETERALVEELECASLWSVGLETVGEEGRVELAAERETLGLKSEAAEAWASLLVRAVTPGGDLAELVDAQTTLASRLRLKQNEGGHWAEAWALKAHKTLTYRFVDSGDWNCFLVDLRKVHRVLEDGGSEGVPLRVILSLDDFSLHLESGSGAVTRRWLAAMREEVGRPSDRLDEQRLSKDDVAVVVKRCVEFLDAWGLWEKGLHRLSGTSSRVRQLLAELRADPVQARLGLDAYSVHDVASALRSWLRGLHSPLVPRTLRPKLFDIQALPESEMEEKVVAYGRALREGMSEVEQRTMREVVGHLKLVAELSHANNMTIGNLALIFATTLFAVDADFSPEAMGSLFPSSNQEIQVLADLIANYDGVFGLSAKEVSVRAELVSKLPSLSGPGRKGAHGAALLCAVHFLEQEREPFQMEVSKTADEVVAFARRHKGLEAEAPFALFECLRGGALERRMWGEERLVDVVVKRWQALPAPDLQSAFLLLKRDWVTARLAAADPYPFAADARLADDASGKFRKAALTYAHGDVVAQRDGRLPLPRKELRWRGEDLLWFLGADAQRDKDLRDKDKARKASAATALTFAPRDYVPQAGKPFGFCLAFREEAQLWPWLSAVLCPTGVRNLSNRFFASWHNFDDTLVIEAV